MLADAIKAKIPFISVTTDDIVNARAVLQSIAKKQVSGLPSIKPAALYEKFLYLVERPEQLTPERYRDLAQHGCSAIVVNPSAKNSLVFDAGALVTPDSMLLDRLKGLGVTVTGDVMKTVSGMSLKAMSDLVSLTMVRQHAVTADTLRHTRNELHGPTSGLEPVSAKHGYYQMDVDLGLWLETTHHYWKQEEWSEVTPRGVLLDGPPGVGKTEAAKVIASQWNVPLFRLNLGEALSRWVGESEKHVSNLLRSIDQQDRCVVLVDEVEKVFTHQSDNAALSRVLAQILWWLQERQNHVFVVMTTNDFKALPPELYRPGRIDRVFHLKLFSSAEEIAQFSWRMFETFAGRKPVGTEFQDMVSTYPHGFVASAANIRGYVIDFLKKNNLLDKM